MFRQQNYVIFHIFTHEASGSREDHQKSLHEMSGSGGDHR